jgi:hypothetical protein
MTHQTKGFIWPEAGQCHILIGLFGFDYATRDTVIHHLRIVRTNDSDPPRTAFATYSSATYRFGRAYRPGTEAS